MSFTRPVSPSCLPLPCFFSGTTGTLGKNSSVSLAVTGFDLSHSGWDTGPFSVGQVGHFVPVAPSGAVQRKRAGAHPARFRPPECVNFGAKTCPTCRHQQRRFWRTVMKSKEDQGAVKAVKTRGKRRPIIFTSMNKPDYELAAKLLAPLVLDRFKREAFHAGSGGDRCNDVEGEDA